MSSAPEFNSGLLADQLLKFEVTAGSPARYVIAFSGGLDSTVLCHSLSVLRNSGQLAADILAIHINHDLHEQSAEWSDSCAASAATMGVEFQSQTVAVQTDAGSGLEAAARDARYAALLSVLGKDDWLISAHHRDDQAETLLLNLIRGGGPAGIAGIGAIVPFGPGWLARPMLGVSRAAIKHYAKGAELQWIEDPSNLDRRFDRNFLRHEVLPILNSRWPDVARRLQRSATHAGEASDLLKELAASDLASLGGMANRLPIDQLSNLSTARQRNLIRFSLREAGLPTPTTTQLSKIMDEVISAREDAQPAVAWPGASVRRYRNGLYLLPDFDTSVLQPTPFPGEQVNLGAKLGSLCRVDGASEGLSNDVVACGLHVRPRVGGEEFKPLGQSHTRKLKKLLQEAGIVPWMRDRLPLVYSGEQLVAVGDLWLAADAVSKPGVALRWDGRPALH